MIHSVSANQSDFKAVEFTGGLNVILADRTKSSSEKDTRNGLGKSTLLEIIHFCLGSSARKGSGLIIEELRKWSFTVEITIRDARVEVTRWVGNPKNIAIEVIEGNTAKWPNQPSFDGETGEYVFKIEQWRELLGWALFRLPRLADQHTYKPSFRSLISYFIRRGPDAYTSPFRHVRQQITWDIQLNTAYLLGMNWENASSWQSLRDREEGFKGMKKAIKTGAMEGAFGTVGELETRRIQLEQQTLATKTALDTFRVHPEYESIQRDANKLTKEIQSLNNLNFSDRRRLSQYEESTADEKPPDTRSLIRLYEESGLVFPKAVKRTMEEAGNFHKKIIANRRDFLASEISRINKAISDRELRTKELTDERAKLMQILKTHGALQEMTRLQERHLALKGSLERIQARLRELKNLETKKRNIRAAKDELVKTAERDHEERREIWSKAVRLFNEYSQALYESSGHLIIEVAESGYKYKVDIERSGSEGIEKMKIFCFDLAVLQLQMENRRGIDFLIHDTLIYDSVDTRQRARAFEQAHKITTALGGQYICTINSDMVPSSDFSDDFKFKDYVRLTLSDEEPTGSLLGLWF